MTVERNHVIAFVMVMKQDRYRCLFNKQIILISEKKKCDIGLGLYLIVSFRFFKVTDTIGFTFTLDCNWFVKTTKLLREFYMFMVGGLPLWLAL